MVSRLLIRFIPILLLVFSRSIATAETIHVGSGYPYGTVSSAAEDAGPGDTILVHGGVYGGGEFIEGLQGRRDAWIVIAAVPGEEVVFEGGTEAWHLSDVAWLYIRGFEFRGQRGNGVNIDDGGSYDTPSHHIVIDECRFRDMDASGNNDLLKLSGLDSFEIQDCIFTNGAGGGSGADMVGCHYGLFTSNRFENMGSNAIQAKGGTQFIRIERNVFLHCGQRAVNLGGSTGLEFFRPIDAPFEAADLQVYANVFVGSVAPIAYVGSVRVDVTNNTIWLPENWVLRILQETVDPNRFLSCGDNIFRNNLVVVDNSRSRDVNVGPNTRPESFLFTNNLWYNLDDPDWEGPDLPVPESNSVISEDPLLADPERFNMIISLNSPAVGAGAPVELPERDFLGNKYRAERSIGAVEGNPLLTDGVPDGAVNSSGAVVRIYPNPASGDCRLALNLPDETPVRVRLFDLRGKLLGTIFEAGMSRGEHTVPIVLPGEDGIYTLQVELTDDVLTTQVVRLRGGDE